MKELINAINNVMKEATEVAKNSRVGKGSNAYDGLKDVDVKSLIQPLMQKNNLALFPVSIDIQTEKEVWEQEETWNGSTQVKRKRQFFVEVKTKYMIVHESGQSIEIIGFGHGIDSADKAPGKAQTYALKMALMYTFLIPAGNIDDSDSTHSDDIETPKTQDKYKSKKQDDKPWFNPTTKKGDLTKSGQSFIQYAIKVGKDKALSDTQLKYKVSSSTKDWVMDLDLMQYA